MRPAVAEAIVVEGRYDRAAVLRAVEAVVVETGGFSVFSDGEKLELIRRLAKKSGVVLLTDSDSAGFLIRNHLRGRIADGEIKHAYIPDVAGKERRKRSPSRERLVGVEGMSAETIVAALRRAGATFLDEGAADAARGRTISRADLIAMGLSGGEGSSARRARLVERLGLPSRISSRALFDLLPALLSREELEALLREL